MSFYDWLDEQEKKKKKQSSEQTKSTPSQTKKNQSFSDWLDENGYEPLEKPSTSIKKPSTSNNDWTLVTDDDIAPVKEERKWFDTSVFDDGFQWSDIPKAVVGTSTDVKKNLWSGILGVGEKLLDAGMMLGAAMNQGSMMQAAQSEMIYNTISGKDVDGKTVLSNYQQAQDLVEKDTAEFVAKDLYNEENIAKKIVSDPVKALTGIDSEKDSLLGAKSDSLVQSGGQLIAQLGANAIVPGSGMALMAAAAFGSEAEGALKSDATFDEALLSATISAGAEILTEKIGGISFGGKTLTDAAFQGLSRKMTSKIAKVLITSGKVAADMTAEGAEEILSGYMSAIGQQLTYMEDKEIEELFSKEDMLEAFIGGAVLGGTGSVGGIVQANSKGVDYVTGLTKNEQAVAQKVYEEKLAEKEKQGKVSSIEKTKLYNSFVKDMELGRIDTDTIESVLGGETYESYKSMTEQETALNEQSKTLTDEINTLLDKENPTMRDSERLAEARKELEQVKSNLGSLDTKTAKLNLFSEVDKLTANDTKLRESYFEKEKRGKAFEADLTKYDAKQQETIKKAVESGILNNTRRTHEFVDLVAKISADKGVLFDFTNNQKLKESGFAIDGKQVNGFVTKDGVTLNLNSAKSLDTVVGHEITHVLEGTELYNELQTAIVEYAKSKGDYQGRYDTLTKLYEGIEGANIDSELTAELVGDYIFTDTDFINNLSTNHRNVFQKIYDEIKYLYKVATAGSKEARELERVKKLFDEAYRAETKNTADSGVQYSIGETTDGRFAAVVDNDILSNIDTSSLDDATKKKVKKAASEELKKFSDGFTINGIEFIGNQDSRKEYTRSNYSEALGNHEPNAYLDKMRASAVLDDVIQVATEWKNDNELTHERDDYVDFVRGNTLIKSGDRTYRAVVLAGITSDGRAIFHDVVDVNPEAFEMKKSEPSTAVSVNESPNNILEDSDAPTVAQGDGSVKKQFSFSEEVTEQQNEQGLDAKSEVQYSLSRDSEYMDRSISANSSALHVSNDNMLTAKAVRERIAARMNDIKDRGLVALPDDIEGNTYIANSSYDGTEENTTICPRSLASEAFTDAVSEYLGRPLTVEEQIYISQDLQGRSLTPECTYCYVATDRKAYRAFLGEYINQRDAVIQKVQENPNADISRNGELYKEFLNGRKDTKPMYDRFKMWVDAYKNGKPMIEASNLANINKLMGDINSEFGAELKPQIVDAMKYAQSASWAKKRVNYVAYNGHILKWKQDRINKLNSHYGLRMYSFSDFHPAFVLENMQMITDASVKGLKMLGYTKDIDFVEIFAPSGMNINVSTFGFDNGGNVYENNLIGAEWEKAKALREKYPNVGVTFVATNDNLVKWALDQDWIDVVIPYHLVRTGAEVAKAFGYTNYTSESSDTKGEDWAKGKDKKYIAPTEHNNDKATYLEALSKNHLKPRFERFIDNPNYMKLVNECRQPASESKPVQPIFNEDAAMVALAKLEANGYYQPIGGSVDRMYEIAAEVAEDMTKQLAPVQHSLSEQGNVATTGKFLGKDMALETAPVAETTPDVAPTVEADIAPTPATISETETVEDYAPGESLEEQLAKADESVESLDTETETLFRDLSEQKITEEEFAEKWQDLDKRYTQARQEQERLSAEMTDINNRKYESIDDSDIPPEAEAPYYGDAESVAPVDPFAERDMNDVGKRNVKAYMHENPEVKPFFQDAARGMLFDLQNGVKGERIFNEQMHYESGYEKGWMGTKRRTTGDIADLLDQWGYTYDQIEAGLNAIIEGGGKENNAVSKRIEFMLDNRLRNGYKDVDGRPIPADEGYINLLKEKQIDDYHRESFDSFTEVADQYAPPAEDVAPVKDTAPTEDVAPLKIEPATVTDNTPVSEADKRQEVESVVGDRDSFVSNQAIELYEEISNLKKGVRASKRLGYLLDHGYEWRTIKTALLNIRDNPNQVVNPNSAAESVAREMIGREYDAMVEDYTNADGVSKNVYSKMKHLRTEQENNQRLREQSNADFDNEIARLQAEYEAKKNKNTKLANDILRRIERIQRMKGTVDADYSKRIDRIGERLEKMSKPEYNRAMHRKSKQNEYANLIEGLVGDTSTWKDKKMGLSYKINTLRRNLRDVVKDANGNPDIAKADAIYDELQGKYNHNEAELKRESMRIKKVFQDLKLNHTEDTYAHMLGEFWYNPDTTLTEDTLKEYYDKHKRKIDRQKVETAIKESRKVFDDLIVRMNERLKEQGMKEIPYRKGYFPHFTNPKQGFVAKLFNWKTVDDEIPTSIAGITETFNPERSWQSFNKQRKGDTTDYSLEQGLDTYIHGALDWIYHIEDIQKRRAFENHIRYVHSEEGVKKQIDEIRNDESLDADEAQARIDAVYAEANNPLNNFVTDLRAGTNTLANKKSSMDRQMEESTNRKIYSVMTNLNNRLNANMVVGSLSAALTNFIPITQSWVEVAPWHSAKAMYDTIRSTIRDDGMVKKSDFLTNRLMNEENLYQTGWDKVIDKVAFVMEAIDSFVSQTVWRSKYIQNISKGMGENQAIKNADQFAENVIAGRSRGNQPTIFDAKNPLTKIFTAFQLEVNNQYGYMFKDAPQDSKNKARLVAGYATAFLGAYAYNALYSSLVGRDVALDPISILEDLFKDLFGGDDEEEEPEDIILNLTEDVLSQVPFVGGLLGGGRVPISSAIPYSGDNEGLSGFLSDVTDKDFENLAKELLSPLYYLAMPVGGGQLKKTIEGASMFSDEHPVSGSYTKSGSLRFPVEKTFGNVLKAHLFGQYASENARDYFDNERKPLQEKQIQEYIDVDIPIKDYWAYRDGLNDIAPLPGKTSASMNQKGDYIGGLDLPVSKKNILINNIADRKTPIDMTTYDDYKNFEEFDFASKNPEKYKVLEENGISVERYNLLDDDSKDAYSWAAEYPDKYTLSKAVTDDVVQYKSYTKDLSEIEADKDEDGKSISGSRKEKVFAYIESLPLDIGQKCILFKSQYKADDSMNMDIIEYLNSREDIDYESMVTILKELDFTVEGSNVYWD